MIHRNLYCRGSSITWLIVVENWKRITAHCHSSQQGWHIIMASLYQISVCRLCAECCQLQAYVILNLRQLGHSSFGWWCISFWHILLLLTNHEHRFRLKKSLENALIWGEKLWKCIKISYVLIAVSLGTVFPLKLPFVWKTCESVYRIPLTFFFIPYREC